jgi:hypothetical protein
MGSKYFNYHDFKSALDILKNKKHLKRLKKISQLKSSISKTINKYNHCDSGKEEI